MHVITYLWGKWDKMMIKAERFGLGLLLVLGSAFLMFLPLAVIPSTLMPIRVLAAVFICLVIFSRMVYVYQKRFN